MDFGGSVVVEVGPCGGGEGDSEKDLTCERCPLCRICKEGPACGVMGAAGPLLGQPYHYYGVYVV